MASRSSLVSSYTIDVPPVAQELVGCFDRHPAEVRDKVGTVCVASDIAFSATTSILASNGEHVSAVAAPVSPNVGYRLEPMGNAMVDFLLISVLKCA